MIADFIDEIGIRGRESKYMPHPSEYTVLLEWSEGAQKNLLWKVARKMWNEVIFTLYPNESNGLKKELYGLVH